MLANILIVFFLFAWTVFAVSFIIKGAKKAAVNGNPACLGCGKGCSARVAARCNRQILP